MVVGAVSAWLALSGAGGDAVNLFSLLFLFIVFPLLTLLFGLSALLFRGKGIGWPVGVLAKMRNRLFFFFYAFFFKGGWRLHNLLGFFQWWGYDEVQEV